MEDKRLKWIRDQVYLGFGLSSKASAFEQLLEREDDANKIILEKFLDSSLTDADDPYVVYVYGIHNEIEEEKQVEDDGMSKRGIFYKASVIF